MRRRAPPVRRRLLCASACALHVGELPLRAAAACRASSICAEATGFRRAAIASAVRRSSPPWGERRLRQPAGVAREERDVRLEPTDLRVQRPDLGAFRLQCRLKLIDLLLGRTSGRLLIALEARDALLRLVQRPLKPGT